MCCFVFVLFPTILRTVDLLDHKSGGQLEEQWIQMSASLKFNMTLYVQAKLQPFCLLLSRPHLFVLPGACKMALLFWERGKSFGLYSVGPIGRTRTAGAPSSTTSLPPLLPPTHSPSALLSISGPPSALLNYFGPNGPLRICSQHQSVRGPVRMSSRFRASKLNALAFKGKVASTSAGGSGEKTAY